MLSDNFYSILYCHILKTSEDSSSLVASRQVNSNLIKIWSFDLLPYIPTIRYSLIDLKYAWSREHQICLYGVSLDPIEAIKGGGSKDLNF